MLLQRERKVMVNDIKHNGVINNIEVFLFIHLKDIVSPNVLILILIHVNYFGICIVIKQRTKN